VQVEPIKPVLKAPGPTLLEHGYDGPLSKFAFNFNLRRYTLGVLHTTNDGGGGGGGGFGASFGGGGGGRSGGAGGGGGGVGRDGAGLLDVAFCPGEGGRVLASNRRGRVFLWDERCGGGRPRAELHAPPDRSPVHCVRAAADGQTVIAGTGAGAVHVWDLRGGTGGTAAGRCRLTLSHPRWKRPDQSA
jgi:hypothetical protein